MKSVPLAQNVLYQVIKEGLPFNLALKNAAKTNELNNIEKSELSASVGCALRHYFVFDEVINAKYPGLLLEKECALMICFANSLFVNKYDENEAFNFAAKLMGVDKEEVSEFVLQYKNGVNLIPETYFVHSNEFLSMRFNTPSWLVKMWKKHYGTHLCEKIIRANSKSANTYCRLNYGVDKNEILSNKGFNSVEGFEDMVSYTGKESLKDTSVYKTNDVMPQKLSVREMYSHLDVDPLRGIAFYSGYANNFYLELVAEFGNKVSFEFIAGQPQAFFDAKKNFNIFKMQNVHVYEEKASSIIACLSSKYHTFFVTPLNSNFALLRNTPDYFLRFKKEMFDDLIKGELEALNEASQFVEEGGDLVYFIPTISYKESHGVVERFLLANSHYSLIEEKQFLPCDEYDSSFYYAILRKAIPND